MKKGTKKAILIFMVLTLTFLVMSCTSAEKPQTQAPQKPAATEAAKQESTPQAPKKQVVIGFANLTDSIDFGKTVKASVLKEAEKAGWKVIALDNERKGSKAVENADALALQKVDLFIEFNVDVSVAPTVMEIMNKAKIPVIAVDIPHPGAAFFGVNNYEAGLITGRALANKAKEAWKGNVDLVILVENRKAGEVPMKRIEGTLAGIRESIKVDDKAVARVDAEGDLTKAMEMVTNVLTANPNKKNILIGTLNDPNGQGAFAAVTAAGRQNDVFIASQGADIPSLANLKKEAANCWIGSTAYTPEKYGEYLIPLAKRILNGEKVEPETFVKHYFVDKSNVTKYYPN